MQSDKIKFDRGRQCDQIGLFLKVLGDIVSIKSSPNAWWNFWPIWKATTFHIKLLWLLFGQLLEKIGLYFNLVSGHPGGLWQRSSTAMLKIRFEFNEVWKCCSDISPRDDNDDDFYQCDQMVRLFFKIWPFVIM